MKDYININKNHSEFPLYFFSVLPFLILSSIGKKKKICITEMLMGSQSTLEFISAEYLSNCLSLSVGLLTC